MNFKYINRLSLVLIFFVVYSCEKLENDSVAEVQRAFNPEEVHVFFL